METIEELKDNDRKAMEITRCFQKALNLLESLPLTGETALVKTKIEEAGMWLEKYNEGVSVKLAHRLCR